MEIKYEICEMNADYNQILNYLNEVNLDFEPSLREKTDLPEYAKKIATRSIIFKAMYKLEIIGIAAIYLNKSPDYSFGTFFSVKKKYRREGVAFKLQDMYIDYLKNNNTKGVWCVVSCENKTILKFHKYYGFKISEKFYDKKLDVYRYKLILNFGENEIEGVNNG